jgi:hypothetical protein
MAPTALPPLDRLDPAEAWKPWKPDAKTPFDRKWAGHLYRRAAFGATLAELREAERRGLPATLDLLMGGEPQASEMLAVLTDVGELTARANDQPAMRGWWLYVMLHGGHPLREKMTLFWHNHFATSIAKVNSTARMFNQNRLLRAHSLGKFGPFLQAISKDSAMLAWLDSNSNIKGKPNENYARELMELFSLGVGNYTEKDIREAARAFTGWHTDGDAYAFNPRLHDEGPKTVLKQTGNWNGEDVVRICLEQPACARFLVRKLFHFFISEQDEAPDALIEPLAESFRKSGYDIAALMRTILSSQLFFSEHAYRRRIKCPVEFVMGAVRSVYREFPEDSKEYRPLRQQDLVARIDAMGQVLFAPPNVKGWRMGTTWLNTATVLARDNFAQSLAVGNLWSTGEVPFGFPAVAAENEDLAFVVPPVPEPPGGAPAKPPVKPPPPPEEGAPPTAFDPARVVREEKATQPREVARLLIDVYLPGGVRPSAEARLISFLQEGKPKGPALDRRVREAVHAIMCMPEYQLA